MRFSKVIVGLVIFMNVAFTAAVLIIFSRTGVEPTGLTVAWFGFTTGELWFLSKIKRDQAAACEAGDGQDGPGQE